LPFTIVDGSKLKVVFLEGSAPALPKNFGTSGDAPSSFLIFFRFSFIFSASPSLRFSHQLLGFGIVDVLSFFQPFSETTF
jgi:hypothetical protein